MVSKVNDKIFNKTSDKINKLRNWENQKEKFSKECINDQDVVHHRRAFRGSIYLINFGENVGDEINKKRPGLIISNNSYNMHSNNVVVLPITTKIIISKKTHKLKYKSQFFLNKSKYTFLDFDSSVECEQIKTISKARILNHIGNIDSKDMEKIILKLNKFFS